MHIVINVNDTTALHGVDTHLYRYGKNLANFQYLAALHQKYPKLPLLGTEATLQDPRTQGLQRIRRDSLRQL